MLFTLDFTMQLSARMRHSLRLLSLWAVHSSACFLQLNTQGPVPAQNFQVSTLQQVANTLNIEFMLITTFLMQSRVLTTKAS